MVVKRRIPKGVMFRREGVMEATGHKALVFGRGPEGGPEVCVPFPDNLHPYVIGREFGDDVEAKADEGLTRLEAERGRD
jgi:hypothetical protein